VAGIEPAYPGWKPGALPQSYTRNASSVAPVPEPYAWSIHPEATLATAALGGAYFLAVRHRPPSRWRSAAIAAGLALLVATSVTPLDALSFHLLSAHLLQNVILAEWAPALLVLGLPPYLGRRLGRYRIVRVLTYPAAALSIWLATYFLWHVPWAYDAALEHPTLLLHAEHASYIAAGCLLWWPVIHDEPRSLHDAARAAYLFAAFILASPTGLLLAFLPEPIYDFYDDSDSLWGLSPLTDQQIAGVTMAAEQAIVFFAAFGFLLFSFLAHAEEAVRAAR
jgi:putative membrane protein